MWLAIRARTRGRLFNSDLRTSSTQPRNCISTNRNLYEHPDTRSWNTGTTHFLETWAPDQWAFPLVISMWWHPKYITWNHWPPSPGLSIIGEDIFLLIATCGQHTQAESRSGVYPSHHVSPSPSIMFTRAEYLLATDSIYAIKKKLGNLRSFN